MNDMIFDAYQNCVNDCLIRHNNILDVITKYSETNAKVNRSIVKAITSCKCIDIEKNKNFDHYCGKLKNDLCNTCREIIEQEIGDNLFYLTSLCNLLEVNLYDILLKEYDKLQTLGKFNL